MQRQAGPPVAGRSGGIVNCAECQTDPLTPGHYCPCCGRKLSLQEQRAAEATSPAARCLSCGGPSVDGDVCKSCKEAYASVLSSAPATEPSHDSTPVAVANAAVDKTMEVMLPPPVVVVDEAKLAAAKAAADLTAKAHLAKAANPVPVTRRPIVPVPPPPAAVQSRSRTPMLMMAAAVIVGVIGAAEGARRLGFEWPQRDAQQAQPVQTTAAVETAEGVKKPVERRVSPPAAPSTPKVVAENRPSATAPPRATAKPKASAPVTRRAPVRPVNASAQKVAPVVAPEIPAPAPARPSAPVAAAESSRPPALLTGKFFESSDVDEAPRIATRVEPRLPANLPAGAEKKIAVARVLVSSSGHPHHVSLLRGAMLGRATDEAVVAAVTQWTFSPAKKRGEAVNCWYNIGVPLGQAN